ncbi:MAG: hypothetical protein GX561_09200 [Lentisphaerae bacterium]|nr:hypothetical protein [Lentisphaerota bacterium]
MCGFDLSKNVDEARDALINKPLKATAIERIRVCDDMESWDCAELPQPLRLARLLTAMLSRVSIPIEPHDLLVGRSVERELNEEEEALYRSFAAGNAKEMRHVLLDSGHVAYDWELLVKVGLQGLKSLAQEGLKQASDPEKRVFYEAMIQIHQAVQDYALRYAERANQLGRTDIAERLRRIVSGRPESFIDALQLLWLVTLVTCSYVTLNPTLVVGRLDRILYPLYKSDLEAGRLTREQARAAIVDYYCKHNLNMGRGEHQVGDWTNSTTFLRVFNFDSPQYLLLGGSERDGSPVENELTALFVECIEPSFKNPVVIFRFTEGFSKRQPSVWRTLMEKALGSASLMIYHDGRVIETYRRIGFPLEDCWDHYQFGCNWPNPGIHSAWMQGTPKSHQIKGIYQSEEERVAMTRSYLRTRSACGWPEDMMAVLEDLAGREDQESLSIEDVYHGFFTRMSEFIDQKLAFYSRELSIRRRKPSGVLTFADCFTGMAIEHGETMGACGKYHFELQAFNMFATVVDSIIAVDTLVFQERVLTLGKLLEACKRNFEGCEDVLALCRRCDKFGQDSELSNRHARRVCMEASRLVIEKSSPYFKREGLFLSPCIQSDTWHLRMGAEFGATPDGRLAHTPFSQNCRPSNGSCRNGLTGMFNSLLPICGDGLLSGTVNVDVERNMFEGESGLDLFSSLLGTYFEGGGLQVQVSALSLSDLEAARQDPDRHRDLRVRITGYSGIFVDLSPRLQDDVMGRFGKS